ncbi:DUF2861 family protein [Vibrio sp. JPW-9-11-11]|uniref:DUF2861 family protein n=1 Tax=Vibrio sp. JPW-9-11-11 TaxID=1416532 RepID=UPI001594C76F|nr:DUF2861 family protein [Vibrio sp. JPW-9-11-11]NVD07722.1 DUF2861 family protein [Vibrio sp. JPW-9-11-11]
MNPYWLVVVLLLVSGWPVQAESPWFRPTPIRPALEALLQQNPQRAWQELLVALDSHSVASEQWQPVKQVILSRSECGHRLTSAHPFPPFTLSLISRKGHSSSSYQLKISIESAQQSGPLLLTSPDGERLIHGDVLPGKFYQEWETRDLLLKPKPGLYQLSFASQTISLLLSDFDTSGWLMRDGAKPNRLNVDVPSTTQTCQPLQVLLQWFDDHYDQVGERTPLTLNQTHVQLPDNLFRDNAQYLSASALLYEYQANIKIEYIQRVTLTDVLPVSQ